MIIGFALNAQSNLDSLYAVWQNPAQSDSTRVTAFADYIRKGFLFSQPDSAFALAEEMIVFSIEKSFLIGQGMGLHLQGVGYHLQGDYPIALDYYSRSLKVNEEIRNQKGIANSLNNIGIIYSDQGDFQKSLDSF